MSKRHKITIDFNDDGDIEVNGLIQEGTNRGYIITVLACSIANILTQLGGSEPQLRLAKTLLVQDLEEALFDGIQLEEETEGP